MVSLFFEIEWSDPALVRLEPSHGCPRGVKSARAAPQTLSLAVWYVTNTHTESLGTIRQDRHNAATCNGRLASTILHDTLVRNAIFGPRALNG